MLPAAAPPRLVSTAALSAEVGHGGGPAGVPAAVAGGPLVGGTVDTAGAGDDVAAGVMVAVVADGGEPAVPPAAPQAVTRAAQPASTAGAHRFLDPLPGDLISMSLREWS